MTDKEKAEYYDEWHEYFEPLARIRREVLKSIDDYKAMGYRFDDDLFFTASDMSNAIEIHTEVTNLIRAMLIEIEDKK